METEYLLEMRNIGKSFSGNRVLNDVDIKVRQGEILALVGENGAGKSTLMNILFGMPVIHSTGGFEGEIRIDGQPVWIASPFDAMKLGIGMVHQEFMLIDGYDVAENIKLNRENRRPGLMKKIFGGCLSLLDREAMSAEAAETLDRLGIELGSHTRAGELPVGHKQFLEIARELDKRNIRLIVLDEPTAVLTEREAHQFLECIKTVAGQGISFIFISHRLDEIKAYADQVVVLRDGRLAGDYRVSDVSVIRLSELMVGREVELQKNARREEQHRETAVEFRNFSVNMPGEELHNINFSIQKGEVLGLGGLAGHGKAAVANGLMGLYPAAGEVFLNGSKLRVEDTLNTLRQGVAFVSEDRRGVGLLLEESIELNVTVAAMRVKNRFTVKRAGFRFYSPKQGQEFASRMIKELDIRCTGRGQFVGKLSGGNQQKVCLAKAISMEPDILFVSEPTRGIDIGAKKRILDFLTELNRTRGITIVITSSELAELRSVCDRIAIITEGRVAGVLKPDDEDYKYGLLMSGTRLGELENEEVAQ